MSKQNRSKPSATIGDCTIVGNMAYGTFIFHPDRPELEGLKGHTSLIVSKDLENNRFETLNTNYTISGDYTVLGETVEAKAGN